jgi:biopolymer transport protein ExbD
MAGGAGFDDEEDGITGINVTLLVDIMLVLLIIFMVASSYIVKEAIEVNLPKAATGEELNQDNNAIALILKKDGRLFLNGKISTKDEVAEASKEMAKKKDSQAIIAADRGASHGDVIRLIDLIRSNGLLQFAINIDPDVDPIIDESELKDDQSEPTEESLTPSTVEDNTPSSKDTP